MASITSWMRIEPSVRNSEMASGLQAKVYDPLWLLARQWQLGEFKGEDNGTPIAARLRGESAPLTRYHKGELPPTKRVQGRRYDSTSLPLETLIEQEAVQPTSGQAERLILSAEAGLHFLRLLKQKVGTKYHQAYLQKYAFPQLAVEQLRTLDEDSQRFLGIVAPRTPHGAQLYVELKIAVRQQILPHEPVIEAADRPTVLALATNWLAWYESLFSEPDQTPSAWSSERMEYTFSVAGRLPGIGEQVLTANEYYNGHLDWYAFNLNPGASLATEPGMSSEPFVQTVLPAPVTYRGMPAQRWWEFEDAAVDFGAVEAGAADLVKLLLVEFAVSYGNDWFVIPLELPVGSLCRLQSLVVTDTFGVRYVVKAAGQLGEPHASWRMFRLANEQTGAGANSTPAADLFFLPPSLPNTLEGQPIEEVLFLRDEMANLAWGVERLVESLTGQPLNRVEHYQSLQRRQAQALEETTQPPVTTENPVLHYRLSKSIPDYWIPLVPKSLTPGQPDLRFMRGAMLNAAGGRELALSHILRPDANRLLSIYEEELPREGIRVRRSYQLARWLNGATHLWLGRQKTVGGGEGASGLRFDLAE